MNVRRKLVQFAYIVCVSTAKCQLSLIFQILRNSDPYSLDQIFQRGIHSHCHFGLNEERCCFDRTLENYCCWMKLVNAFFQIEESWVLTFLQNVSNNKNKYNGYNITKSQKICIRRSAKAQKIWIR